MPPKLTRTIRVALLEDDDFLAHMYERKLTMAGIEVQWAADGEQGLALIRAKLPEIVLLDILMPKLDGWEVLAALRADPKLKSIPVVMLTNLGSKEDVDKALSMGATDYMIKAQFNPQEVVDKIKSIVKK